MRRHFALGCEARDQKLVLDFTFEIVHTVTTRPLVELVPNQSSRRKSRDPSRQLAKGRMAVLVNVSIVGSRFDCRSSQKHPHHLNGRIRHSTSKMLDRCRVRGLGFSMGCHKSRPTTRTG